MRAEGESILWEPLVVLGPDVEAYSDTDALKGTMYSYIIRTVNDYGFSSWSDSARAVTLGVSAAFPVAPSIDIYPNPLKNSDLTLRFTDESEKQVNISNISGSSIFGTSTSRSSIQISRSMFRTGIYLITLVQGGTKAERKLVVL
jgi:hypothetical protein